MTEEQKKTIEALYSYFSTTEIAKKTGISLSAIRMYSYRKKLKHTDECLRRIRKEVGKIASSCIKENTYKQISETKRKIAKREKRRIIFGEHQQTKMRLSVLPLKVRRRMIYMCNVFHYFRDDDINKLVLYYDSETNRSLVSEKNAERQYGIKFIQADD